MKKSLSILLSMTLALVLSLSAFAALSSEITGYFNLENGEKVSGTVKTTTTTVSVSGTSYPRQATGMISQINKIRKDAGLPTLKRDTRLTDAAKQRAFDISVQFSHTRPDGTKWRTLNQLANGENLGKGVDNFVGIVGNYTDRVSNNPTTFMESESHRKAILDTDFTRVETYVIETGGEMYWVQLFGADQPAKAGSGATSSPSIQSGNAVTVNTPVAPSASASELKSAKLSEEIKKAKASGGVMQVSVKNYSEVSPATLQEAVKAAGNNKLMINADTTDSSGKAVTGRMYINAADFTKLKENLKLGVNVNTEHSNSVQKKFAGWYKNKTAVVSLDQKGSLGKSVQIAAKVDLSDLKTDSLVFYAYDSSSNSIQKIENTDYKVKDGYLYFYTLVGGDIVVADSALTK